MPQPIHLVLIGAGGALVVQNLLMARLSDRVPTIFIPLLLNALVGLVLLTGFVAWQSGLQGMREAAGAVRPWVLLPGVLGTFFVYASLSGYQRLGAAPTIALVVSSQLIIGLGVDLFRASPGRIPLAPVLGVALLIADVILVLSRKA